MTGSLGSQAEATDAVSQEFARWVNRAMGWVRRKATRVWGLERHRVAPELDVSLPDLSSVYALPGAMAELETGARGRN